MDITDVELAAGEPRRGASTREAGFRFDKDGAATWLFIEVENA